MKRWSAAFLLMAIPALAQSGAQAQSAGDYAWMLVSAALVLMMTGPGLALFYGGLVRTKNVLGTMMQNFILMAIITVLWAVVGYSLAFSEGTPVIGGLKYLFLNGVGADPNSDYGPTIPHQTYMVYQLMFAIITPALISGAPSRGGAIRQQNVIDALTAGASLRGCSRISSHSEQGASCSSRDRACGV